MDHLLRILMMTIIPLLCVSTASAASIEALLMPGKLSAAHIKQEEHCSNCHDRSNVRTQSSLCLDCHKDIDLDVRTRHGYHGRMPNAGQGECRACHSEHKGRNADIVQLDTAQFDHSLTEFPLQGAHAAQTCGGCHLPSKPWNQVPAACRECHRNDDVHHQQFRQSCGECHTVERWSNARFDHATTGFALNGAHQKLACNTCHLGGRYSPTPKTCNGCHATDDVHRGSRGEACGSCHNTTDWKAARFDHLKETGYALLGAHAEVDCLGCHRSGSYKEKIPKDCSGCHHASDAHAGRFGSKCDDCHGNDSWEVSNYDHLERHQFALLGAHAKLSCHDCHTAPVARQKLPRDCGSCHRSDTPHDRALKAGCESCHGQSAWRPAAGFEHDLTEFPLVGLHRLVSCAQCHRDLRYTNVTRECIGCHRSNDVHHGGFGERCASCHSTAGWSIWTFDHARVTGFALDGGHARLTCAACHQQTPGSGHAKTSPVCVSCHRKDDRHLGAYGSQCDRCHTTDSWKGARVQ